MSNPFNILGRKSGVLNVVDILKLPQLLKALGYAPEGTVLQTYETEIEAIEAGLGYGAPYIDASGQLQVVSKVKQVLNFETGSNNYVNYFCIAVEQDSYDIEDIFADPIANISFTIQGSNDSGSLVSFDPSVISFPGLNSLTALELGRGYKVVTTTPFTLTLYGAPIDRDLRRALPNANVNYVGYYGGFGENVSVETVFADLIGAGKVDAITRGTLSYDTDTILLSTGDAVNINTNATATQVGTTDPVARNTSI